MTLAATPIPLEKHQLAEAGDVLARAFHDDPIWTWVFPDAAERARVLPWFMETGTRYCWLFGESYTTPGRIEGAADWLTPGNTNFPPQRLLEAGYAPMPERFGAQPYARFQALMACTQPLHDRDVPAAHYYLMTLGVDPPRQGQGVGSALIQPILRRADAEGLPCYLETEREINVKLYRRHGFEVVVEVDVPDGGPHIWTMLRKPEE